MAGSGFSVFKSNAAGVAQAEQILSLASTTYKKGDMITVQPASGNKGVANKVAAADKGTHIVMAMILPDDTAAPATPAAGVPLGQSFTTTADQEKLLCLPVMGSRVILKSYLTGDAVPPINGTACNSNSTATEVLVTAAGSTGDYTNGTLYCPETGEQFLVTDDQVAAGVHTFTIAPAAARALTTGDTAVVVPFSKGCTAVKFNATTPHQCVGTAVADKSGGQIKIEDVNLKGDTFGAYVLCSIPATS